MKGMFRMKNFALLAAALTIACPAAMTPGVVSADETVITPEQWNSVAVPAAPENWRHVETSGDAGQQPPEDQAGKAAPAKENKETAPARKVTKETAETKEAPPGAGAPEYRIFNLNLPAPEEKPQAAPEAEKPKPEAAQPAPGYIEKGGMIIPNP